MRLVLLLLVAVACYVIASIVGGLGWVIAFGDSRNKYAIANALGIVSAVAGAAFCWSRARPRR